MPDLPAQWPAVPMPYVLPFLNTKFAVHQAYRYPWSSSVMSQVPGWMPGMASVPAAAASDGVSVAMLGKSLDATKGQAATLLSSLPNQPKVGDDGRLDGYA